MTIEQQIERLAFDIKHKEQSCQSCQFYLAEWPNAGRCRIRAKTVNGFPVVECSEWCGEWKMAFPKKDNANP